MMCREMTASDRRYVVPTWAQSSRYDGLRRGARFAMVDSVLDAGARVVVLANGPTVHVWACGDGSTLHYVYMSPELRGHGLGRRIITELFGGYPDRIDCTHPWPRESQRFRYTPHLITRIAA